MEGGKRTKRETEINSCGIVRKVVFNGCVEDVGGLDVTDVARERILYPWITVRERALAKGFSFNVVDAKCPCVCRRTKMPGRGVHSEKVREIGRG